MRINKVLVGIIDNGLRKIFEGVLIHILRLVLLMISHLLISSFGLVVVLRHKVPNLRLVELSQSYLILLVDFAVNFTKVIVMRKEIGILIMVILAICRETILYLRYLQGLIIFQLQLL